jgi:pimeloyl-ACP methyl ester carboxylesterase
MPKIAANNIELYYETQGKGPALVFIHGLGSSARDWELQVAGFSKTYTVITFDLRGHGQSDKPPGAYSLPMFAADTAGLLHALGIESAHVVGLSLGGCVAFQLSVDHPALLKTMIIVNSAPTMGGNTAEFKQEIRRRVAIVQQRGMRAMGEDLSKNLFPKAAHAAIRQTFVERWAENEPRPYIASLLSMSGWSVVDQLGSIHCPTLIIAADQDYSPVAVKEAYVKLMPNARLVVIPEAHHATPTEEPKKFNAVLASFLALNN